MNSNLKSLGLNTLKPRLTLTPTTVECPVAGCQHHIPRQRRSFRRDAEFKCPIHSIYISPSTFEYERDTDNMLWTDVDDLALWSRIRASGVKRESRMARDNSEDAVTWNVFRYLQHSGSLGSFVDQVVGEKVARDPQLIYWSLCPDTDGPWSPLVRGCQQFGESVERRSEPDLIIDDQDVLIFIEAKLGSTNVTSRKPTDSPKLYPTACDGWYGQVFRPASTYDVMAVSESKYELMRLWLIGTRMAHETRRRFYLVNLLRDGCTVERDIEERFNAHVLASPDRRFLRWTWERIHADIISRSCDPNATTLSTYMEQKTLGYRTTVRDGQECGELRRAFNIPTAGVEGTASRT